MLAVCEVCRLVDGDRSVKECSWCQTCRAWICTRDLSQWGRRALAMIRRGF
jgi:hypothetical protein